MSNKYTTRNRTTLFKIETTIGEDPSPVVGSDAVLLEDPEPGNGLESAQTNESTSSLDPRSSVFRGGNAPYSAKTYIKGSGAGGTPPEWAKTLLRAAGFGSATSASAVTGTAQAGATGSITLAADDAFTTSQLVGVPVTITGGTGSGQTRVATANNGSTKVVSIYPNWTTPPDNTSTYSIAAFSKFSPVSSDLKTLTAYDYQHSSASGADSRLAKIHGLVFDARFTMPASAEATIDWNGQGIFTTPTDVSKPSAPTLDATRPVALLATDFVLNSVATKFNTISMALGNQIAQPKDASATYGRDAAGITGRRLQLTLDPQMDLLSVRNSLAALIAGTSYKGWLRWGGTAGNRFSLYWPGLVFNSVALANIEGFRHETITADCTGEDSGVYIVSY